MKGRTVIVIAHRLSTVERADRILIINKGRLVEQGSHAELLQAEGLYNQLVRRQLTLGYAVAPAGPSQLKPKWSDPVNMDTISSSFCSAKSIDSLTEDGLNMSPKLGTPVEFGTP